MDVDSLRAELEQHLEKNPHPDAPDGFRDRFETVAEQLAAADGDFPKSVLEGQLQQIWNEAEAAANAADAKPAAMPKAAAPAARPKAAAPPAPAADSGGDDAASTPAQGGQQRTAIVAGLVAAALVAAFFYFR